MNQTEIVYALAHIGPATANEIEEWLGYDKRHPRNTFTRAWRNGFILRRRRESTGVGEDPYEYTIAPPKE